MTIIKGLPASFNPESYDAIVVGAGYAGAVCARRLHDTDRSGWWMLIALIPLVGWIVLLIFMCLDSTPGENRFGANPKGA